MILALLPLLLSADPAANALTSDEQRDGWILLFDGATANGWQEVTGKPFPTNSWRIEDGCLHAFDPGGGSLQDIRTVREFPPAFSLQFDWKIGKAGNSGVKYLVRKTDEWTNAKGRQARARGFEYQLFDDASGIPNGDRRKITASLYDGLPPVKDATKPVGEFNHSMIRVADGRVEHWLNGTLVLQFSLDSAEVKALLAKQAGVTAIPALSYLSLQNHGSPVWFRNIKVRSN